MKLHQKRTAEPQNIECRMSKVGIASGFTCGYAPTRRSIVLIIDRIHYSKFDVGRSMFDVH